ncbi:MAG: hypothetical protein N2445_08035, partial [Acidobacteria bacterium]|nr:hypothetical protein [Acidobacteriota bacterium]
MKKSLFFLLFLLPFFVPSLGQEVVVFVDDRSMTVTSHKERDGFVYLQLPEGEIAVPKKQIKEIRKETGSTSTVSQAVSQKLFSPESDLKSSLPDKRRAINPLKNDINKRQIEQKPSSEDDEDIDEADGGEE